MEYISENFDKVTFESLFSDPRHKEIKHFLNLDDKQIDIMLAVFDTICSKYGFPNKHILLHYLLPRSFKYGLIRHKTEVIRIVFIRIRTP